jgi:hypothetical protein
MQLDERLAILIRILDPEDYRFVAGFDLRIERDLRRKRLSIYREGLRDLRVEIVDAYHAHLSNINAAARWGAYPTLLWNTGAMFVSLSKLWIAGSLFGMRLPVVIDLNRQHQRLAAFLAAEGSAPLHHSRV